MGDRHKLGLVWLALIFTGLCVVLLCVYAIAAPMRQIRSDVSIGRGFYRIVYDFQSLKLILGPLGVVITAGLAAITGLARSRGYFQVMAGILLVGLVAVTALVYFVAFDSDIGPFIAANAPTDMEPREFRNLTYPVLEWAAGAIAAGLATLFGVSKLGASTR